MNRDVAELHDFYNDRTLIDEPHGTGVTFRAREDHRQLRDRMERVILYPIVEVAVADHISVVELALMSIPDLSPR